MHMKFQFSGNQTQVLRPKVTPDMAQATLLQEKLQALSYRPMNGFHKDQREARKSLRELR